MKEYRLTGWPDLDSDFDRTPYRRMLHQMSQRYTSVTELAGASGLRRSGVREFMSELETSGHLDVRKVGLVAQMRDLGAGALTRLGEVGVAVRRSLP